LIVMDVMMPKMDGITACKEIKSTPGLEKTAVIFLTARSEEGTELSGFDAGGDDYINKPLKPRILISRIKAILARLDNKVKVNQKIEYKNLSIDKETYLVNYKGNELTLPKKEFELLFLLASKPGKVFTRERILEEVWGTDVIVVDRTIDVHIRKLREKLDDKIITTIKGVGYKFVV
jgi:two-component system alkaline phosphatase synthesis response regulator PhoP